MENAARNNTNFASKVEEIENEVLDEASEEIEAELRDFNEPVIQEDNTANPYPTKVDFNKEQYSFFEIKRSIEEFKEIKLDPDFQRSRGIWPKQKQIRLIESIIMGIPLPLFYFVNVGGNNLSVVDGLQRLHTVIGFMNDEFSLSKLTYLSQYNGLKFSKLDRTVQAAIEKYQIQANIISSKTPEKIKLDIFERINSGGSPLNKQEIRNAIYQGKSTALLNRLTELPEFTNIIKTQINSKRMRDKYVVLRFLAFYLWANRNQYNIENLKITANFDTFLAETMKKINDFSDNLISELEVKFKDAIAWAYGLYGNNSFKRSNVPNNPFNMVMFESVMFLLASIENPQLVLDTEIKSFIADTLAKETINSKIVDSLKGKKAMEEHFQFLQNALIEEGFLP